MAIGDTPNQNLFGTNYNSEEEEEKKARLAAQGARMGAGGVPASAFGQAPAVNPFSMEAAGQVNPMMQPQSLEVTPQALAELPVEANANVNAKAISMADANNPAFEGMSAPEIISAVNAPDYQTPVESKPPLVSLSPFSKGVLDNLLKGTAQPQFGIMGIDPTQSPYKDTIAATDTQPPSGASALEATQGVTPPVETPSEGAQEQVQAIPQGAPGSAQANFATRMETGEALSPQEIQDAQAFAASMGTTFDPATGYSREAFENAQSPTPSQFMRYEDSPEQRTEQFVDEQGRMRFRPTQEALQLQAQGEVSQPPVAALSSFEKDSLARQQRIGGTGSFEGDSEAREARLRAEEIQPGETQTQRDTRIAQSRTTGGQTEGLSFDDARRRAEGQLAARGVKNPTPSQVNALARGIQAGEPERLAELETKRAINEARLKTAQATLDRPEFEGNVYTVNGVTFAQTSRGGAQVIDTGTETDKESTKKMKDFEFTSQKIKEAREAYLAGDLTKANDIITAAEIQKDGFATNATEYFKDSITPPASKVTDSGLTQQQIEAGIQRVMADNKITREEAIKALEKKRPEIFKVK